MKPAARPIRCRPDGHHGDRNTPDVLPMANVCTLLLPFLLLCSPDDVFRVFNIATSAQPVTDATAHLHVGNHGVSLSIGASVLASGPYTGSDPGLPPAVGDALATLARNQPRADIIVQPDTSATYADVVGVLDTLHAMPAAGDSGGGRRIIVAPVTP